MSNYTDLQDIRNYSEENNANVNNTIDENIYSNTEQEITPDMINEAVKAVEDDRFNNTDNIVDYLKKTTTKNVKIRLYDGLGVEWYSGGSANIYTEETMSLLLIQVPKYTNIYAYGLTEEMWQKSCVLDGFVDGDDITGRHSYASIDNWRYRDTSAQYSDIKIYRVYGGTSYLPDTVYHWSEDGELEYISGLDTTIVFTVRDEAVSDSYYSPSVDVEGTEIIEEGEEVESLTFEENNFFDNDNNFFNMLVSQKFRDQYYFEAIKDVTTAFKTKVIYRESRTRFNQSTSKWEYVGSTYPYMRIISLSPLDTLTLCGYRLSGFGVSSNYPSNGQTPDFVDIYPTIDKLTEDWGVAPVNYTGSDTSSYLYNELKITNTTESTIYIWFNLNFPATVDYYLKINGNDIFYNASRNNESWTLRNIDFYYDSIMANNSDKIDMLYKELGKMHQLLYDIIQNIQ